jgi:hypothetical protein
MSLTPDTKDILDEVALQSCSDNIQILLNRLRNDREYSISLRISALELLHQLWPAEKLTDDIRYVVLISNDIDDMPLDLLEQLSSCLTKQARCAHAERTVASSAAKLISGWLKARAIEIRAEGKLRDTAHDLKTQHTRLFMGLFEVRHERA